MAEARPDAVMADAATAPPIFDEFTFTIVPSDGLLSEDLQQLAQIIVENGGRYLPVDANTGRIANLAALTHIVSTTSDFPDYLDAFDGFKHVVKPSWVQDSVHRGRATNPRQYSPDPALFMSEVIVFCADIPEGDEEAIKGGVMAMGGNYTDKLSKFVTHIVALSFDSEACALVVKKNLKAKIVLPHWFDDCLRLGRKVSEQPYTLPDPEILKAYRANNNQDPPHTKNNKDINGASNPMPPKPPMVVASQQAEKVRTLTVFKGLKVKIAEELDIGPKLRSVIAELIENGGGEVTIDINEASTYICHYRDGDDYISASQAGKDVGNLAWLYYIISHNKWTSPTRRLLHYPIPRKGIPGFENLRICLSNYTGEARIYLENLVKATGAEYTKTMKQDNTHLLTAHTNSEKCSAAREWGINIVNHLWIEESYAECKLLTLTTPRFTHFPPRTNLGEVVGQVQFNRDALERNYYPRTSKILKAPKAAESKQTTALLIRPSKAHDSSPLPSDPEPQADGELKQRKNWPGAKTPVPSRINENKENQTPGTSGSRGAKARALSKLHELAPDVELYQKEMKRVGGVTHGRERRRDRSPGDDDTEDSITVNPARELQSRKRSHEPEDDKDDLSEPKKTLKKKKSGKTAHVPILHHMLVTKYEPWVGNMKKEDEDRIKLRELGITLTNEKDRNVTLLCAPKIVRTKKFVSALAAAPTIVSTQYIDYCLEHSELPDPEDFPLEDLVAESKFGIKLKDSLRRAKQNKRRLLKDWPILCTEDVAGGWQTYADIVEANGGKCLLWKGRTNMTVTKRGGEDEEDDEEEIYLISELKESEVPLWEKFRDLAAKHNMIPRIVSTEWLLFVTMAQYVVYDEKWALSEQKLKGKGKR